jgi:hypothetical protein
MSVISIKRARVKAKTMPLFWGVGIKAWGKIGRFWGKRANLCDFGIIRSPERCIIIKRNEVMGRPREDLKKRDQSPRR